MATTTNFGWPTPDNTSYVRNGASDMRTLGSAIDTSMADLKGGTTGQVLKKNTNTDMDFVWAAESGGISPTIFDAKGDLIGASAADTAARLAVGSDDQVLVADSSASTGLAWKSYGAQLVAGKNKILNGDFGIWQRGTTFTNSNSWNGYAADRWYFVTDGSGSARTISQQTFTPGSAPVTGYESAYFIRWNETSAGSGSTYHALEQHIEDVRTFAGQTVTLSFWAKADAARTISTQFSQSFGTGGSSAVYTTIGSVNLTTSWQRFTLTVAVPSVSGKTIGASSFLNFTFLLPINAVYSVDIWGVQLEAGSVATPFTTATGNPASELAACQRYYFRTVSGNAYGRLGFGMAQTTTTAQTYVKAPATMRVSPTSVDYGGNLRLSDIASGTAVSTVTLNTQSTPDQATIALTVASGLTAYRPYFLESSNDATAYIGFSAEL